MLHEEKRTLFQASTDRDYSGLDLFALDAESLALDRSFFNGADIRACRFLGCDLSNSELAEAHLTDCYFEHCHIPGVDFINSALTRCEFSTCILAKGEWRSSTFSKCTFTNCNFDHNTVTLCTFIDCHFDEATIESMQHRAIYSNVFSSCRFEIAFGASSVFSRNFGVPVGSSGRSLVANSQLPSLEQICLLNNGGVLKAVDVAMAANGLNLPVPGLGGRRASALVFYSNILTTLTEERRLSATTLTYIESVISQIAAETIERDQFISSMSALVQIRNCLFNISHEEVDIQLPPQDRNAYSKQITIHFSETFLRPQIEDLCTALSDAASADAGSISVDRIEWGSTTAYLLTTGVAVSSVLMSLNLILRQATVLVERITEFSTAVQKLNRTLVEKRTITRSHKKQEKLPAIMSTRAVTPNLAPVRAAIKKGGKSLVEMDEKAEVIVYY